MRGCAAQTVGAAPSVSLRSPAPSKEGAKGNGCGAAFAPCKKILFGYAE